MAVPAGMPPPEYPDGYIPKQSQDVDHFTVVVGASIADRYKILRMAGEGHFSKVCECWDLGPLLANGERGLVPDQNRIVAVKVVRAVPEYAEDAAMEHRILQRIAAGDSNDQIPFVKCLGTFTWNKHFCLCFPNYGGTLYDFIRKHGTFLAEFVVRFAHRVMLTLDYLHNKVQFIHTDLKPENIILEVRGYSHRGRKRVPRTYNVRIADFGAATLIRDADPCRLISTRHYRAPEVVLGVGWAESCDMWSVGCILYEMVTGRLLFDTHKDVEHLALMERATGQVHVFSERIAPDIRKHFVNGKLVYPSSAPSRTAIRNAPDVREVLSAVDPQLANLVMRCLDFDPKKRITARQALTHPFIVSCPDLWSPPPASRTLGDTKHPPKAILGVDRQADQDTRRKLLPV